MSYLIDDGIKMPTTNSKSVLISTIEKLEIGQSFALSGNEKRGTVSSSIWHVSMRTGRKFKTRTINEVLRIWRLE